MTFKAALRIAFLSALAMFGSLAVKAAVSNELYSALEEVNGAIRDDGDTVFVSPTKTLGLANLVLNQAIKICKEKDIDTLVFEEGEFVFTSSPKKKTPQKDAANTLESAENFEKGEKEEPFFLFTIFDDEDDASALKVCKESPPLSGAAVKIDGFEDFIIDASKAKIVCPKDVAAFAFTNSSSIKIDIGEIAERQGAQTPALAFALCKNISIAVKKAAGNSRNLLFEGCTNIILRNSEFSCPFDENSKAKGDRSLSCVEFVSCKNAVLVRNSMFSNTSVRPIMIRSQTAHLKKSSGEASAIFEMSKPDFAMSSFAKKGDTVAFFTPEGAPFAKRKISEIKDLRRGDNQGDFKEKLFEISFDSPIADILMFCGKPLAINLSNSAKYTVSNNNFSNNAAEFAVSAYGGVDFVSNSFSAQNVSPVKILSDPKNGVCGLSAKICFIRNNFICYDAPAILSESHSKPKDEKNGAIEPVLRNLRILKNSFKLENSPVVKLVRSADISILENQISISPEGAVILDFEKSQNASFERNAINGAGEVRISNRKCEGEIKMTENSGAQILIKRVFK